MYHFINCMVLAFAPHVIIYKATKLAEESGLRACVCAALGYALTQIVKIFVMASVLPTASDDAAAIVASAVDFSLFEEVAKSVISLVEVVGVQYVFSLTPNLAKFSAGTRVLAIGLGMAFAESALKYALPLFWGARGMEFSWSFLEMSLASNVSLLLHIAFVAFVWLRTRTDINKATLPIVWTALATVCALPSIDNYLTLVVGVDSWSLLAFHGVLSLALAVVAKVLLGAYNTQRLAAIGAATGKKGQ